MLPGCGSQGAKEMRRLLATAGLLRIAAVGLLRIAAALGNIALTAGFEIGLIPARALQAELRCRYQLL